ncbi:hypothetical protein EJP82_26220 [Paenibacillus anaericanus]|uniref:site-specific DNA-methyltransferase (adenine-specific) n=1 Tax=Paenibacillus anaericanus TaxID=170367 RepID=A0A3S1C0Q4_9BACL|nr:Eco57I restriction-modification methylase domain-containing protein [Paenibacillus anaericanus]RUT39398.1 hypothetical protein EJP82_26220 [Paenibacillus anaericanus]
MNTTPASIKEKKLIKDYADIYQKCKIILERWLSNQYDKQFNTSDQAHQILLILTLVKLIDANENSVIPLKVKIALNIGNSKCSDDCFIIWSWISSFFVRSDDHIFCLELIKLTWGIPPVSDETLREVNQYLKLLPMDDKFFDLLPYVLEVFEYEDIDLNTALIDPKRGMIPSKKKRKGIYYTPDDVVNHLVSNTLGKLLESNNFQLDINNLRALTVLDPSCGTGIFLKKSLVYLVGKYKDLNVDFPLTEVLMNNIYGVDRSPSAVRSCVLILLTSDLNSFLLSNHSPFVLWNLALMNIRTGDSVNGILPQDQDKTNVRIKQKMFDYRLEKKRSLVTLDGFVNCPDIQKVLKETLGNFNKENYLSSSFHYYLNFPEVFLSANNGFSCVIGNPPYTDHYIKENSNQTTYISFGGNIYTLFVENMKYLSGKNSISGMIIPLSISYHTGQIYKNIREMFINDSAEWVFTHFDRSPDSLFGDDIKTRNTIVFRQTIDIVNKKMYTSSLLRWNSRDRDKLFNNINIINIGDFNIANFIPKISSELELKILKTLLKQGNSLYDMVKLVPKKSITALGNSNNNVYFYSTAYNWLPTFLKLPESYDKDGKRIVPDSLWAVNCSSMRESRFVFACLASTISYWLWAVQGDGFHFSSQLLKKLPFNKSLFSETSYNRLISLADDLWIELIKYPINKVNSGKSIGNYNFLSCRAIIDQIDNIIIQEVGLPSDTLNFVNNWYINMIQAGRGEFKNSQFFKV